MEAGRRVIHDGVAGEASYTSCSEVPVELVGALGEGEPGLLVNRDAAVDVVTVKVELLRSPRAGSHNHVRSPAKYVPPLPSDGYSI